jgi:hypothetical protein
MRDTQDLAYFLGKLRPLIIAYYQDKEVEKYTKEYGIKNGGKSPSKNEIDNFIVILIERSLAKTKADEIIEEYINKYGRPNITYIITKSLFFVPSITIYILYLLLYLRNQNYNLANDTIIFNPITVISSLPLIIYSIFLYVHVMYSEVKG